MNGKVAWKAEPEVKLPDFDDLRKAGKWTGKEKWVAKYKSSDGRFSSFFFEGLNEQQVENMIGDAFKVKKMDGREWLGIVDFEGNKIKIHGYIDTNGEVSSAFIESVN